MIIEEIRLHNFGVYRGRHVLRLEPTSKRRPLVIVGALNGSGKTTLLDAMQLALYGKQGTYASRGEGSYDDFLRRAINHNAADNEGASVELVFRQAREGVEQQYRAQRSWRVSDGKVKESFQVLRDGAVDELLSDHWYEYVEELLPARIAPLFFFDGEKVVDLADVRQAPALLRVAIQSLLGLDIVQQLRTDLGVLTRRKRTELSSDEERASLTSVQNEIEALEQQRDFVFQTQASCKNELEQAKQKSEGVLKDFRENGGELFQQRTSLEDTRAGYEVEKRKIEQELRELAATDLPLALLAKQLAEVSNADRREQEASNALAVFSVLESRDEWIATLAKDEGVSADAILKIRKALADDRTTRKAGSASERVFNLSHDGRLSLEKVARGTLEEKKAAVVGHLKDLELVSIKIADVERKLTAVPSEESVRPLLEAVEAAAARVSETVAKFELATEQLREVDSKREILRKSLVRALEMEVGRHNEGSDSARILTFASRASGTLERFEQAVIRHHIHRLEALVLQALQTLLRKSRLITKVEIDPESYEIRLSGDDGRTFSMERLSAGERQLLAVSLLWGLAQASGRPMPTIIDTPLGRLDSEHRNNLVDRYFPKASHQVILLSTDMEIDADHYRKLKPSVSHSYTLTFDPKAGGTRVAEGLAFAEGKPA